MSPSPINISLQEVLKMDIKTSVIRDSLNLIDPRSNNKIITIPYEINITNIVNNVTQKQKALAMTDENDHVAMGKSFCDLVEAIFGQNVVKKLLDFYKDNYIAMVADLTPVLMEEIFPLFDEYRKLFIDSKKKMKIDA